MSSAPVRVAGERRDLAEEVLPILPDIMGEDEGEPHPDGRPWRKACADCAFRRHDPQGYGADTQESLREGGNHTFWCLHRKDEGCDRVCASYAAIQRGKALARTAPAGDPSRGGEGPDG